MEWEGSIVRRPSSSVVVRPLFQTSSFLKPLSQLLPNFICSLPEVGERGKAHMTNMAVIPIYGKNLKKSSTQEPIDP